MSKVPPKKSFKIGAKKAPGKVEVAKKVPAPTPQKEPITTPSQLPKKEPEKETLLKEVKKSPKPKVPKETADSPSVPSGPLTTKQLKAKLRKVVKYDKEKIPLLNKTEISSFIEGLPEPKSPEYRILDPKFQGIINIAYHKAENSLRGLIMDSELSGKVRFGLCEFYKTKFSSLFSDIIANVCDVWKHRKSDKDAHALEELYLLLCDSPLITSELKLKIAAMLYNSGSLISTYVCFQKVVSDQTARWKDRVEACKFLLTSEDPENHELAQEVLCEIIDLPEVTVVSSFDPDEKSGSEYEEGSRSSATSYESDDDDDESSSSVPSFLKDSESDSEGDDLRRSSDRLAIPKTKRIKPSSEEKKAKREAIKKQLKEQKEDDRWLERTKIRYAIIAEILSTKKVILKSGKSNKKKVITVEAIKSHINSEKLLPSEDLDLKTFILPVATLFVNNEKNHIRQRILAASVLYEATLSEKQKEGFEFLITVGNNKSYIEDVRADALDVILRLAGKERASERQQARKLLIELGREAEESKNPSVANRVRTIYQNSQNVHDENVSEAMLNFINSIDPGEDVYSFVDIEKDLANDVYKKLRFDDLQKKKARSAIYRCSIDHSLFGDDRHSVRFIFSYIWTLIQNYRDKEEVKVPGENTNISGDDTADLLEKRFAEALVEMGDTCTTGHVARLVQVLDGYGVDMAISFTSQIIGNVSGRISAIARDVKDPKIREILDLGVMEDAEPKIREQYQNWMKKELSKLEKVLWEEFKDYVKKPEFTKAFNQASGDLLGAN